MQKVIAPGEEYVFPEIEIIERPDAFDESCKRALDSGEIWHHNKDGILRPCVSNDNAQWVLIPGGKAIPFLNTASNVKVLGTIFVDHSLPSKGDGRFRTVFSRGIQPAAPDAPAPEE